MSVTDFVIGTILGVLIGIGFTLINLVSMLRILERYSKKQEEIMNNVANWLQEKEQFLRGRKK